MTWAQLLTTTPAAPSPLKTEDAETPVKKTAVAEDKAAIVEKTAVTEKAPVSDSTTPVVESVDPVAAAQPAPVQEKPVVPTPIPAKVLS